MATEDLVLDHMVARLKHLEVAQRKAIRGLERLPVRRSGRLARDRLLRDLQLETDKTNDSLTVFGFYPPASFVPPED